MKRKLLLLSAVVMAAFSASAQNAWHVQNSGFTAASRGINGFSVVDSNVVWATAYDGTQASATIREYTMTTDGGATWLAGTVTATGLNANFGLANISAIDADTAYASIYPVSATAAPQGVYKTTNAGATWTKVTAGKFTAASSFVNVVHFFDAKDGVALGDPANGYFEAYTTNDYGVTWTRVPQANIPYVPQTEEYGTVGYYGANDSTILYSTNYGNILISKDRGITWAIATTPLNTAGTYIPKLEFKDKNTVLAIIGNNTISPKVNSVITSIDGGSTWAYAGIDTAADIFDFNDISFVPGTANTWFITSANFSTGGLGTAYTEDGGVTWIGVDKIQHTAVQFNDINNGWSGGFNTSATVGGMFKWGSVRLPASVSYGKVDAFKVYPNPSNDLVYVSANVNGASTIKVTDMMGRVVFEKSYPTKSMLLTSFDVSNYASGLYFVEVSESNNRSVQKVLVK